MSSKIQITKECLFCRKSFTALTLYTRYCSHTCNQKHYKQLKREAKIQEHQNKKADAMSVSIGQALTQSVQEKQFLSISEVAELIGASKRTIQRLIAKGMVKTGKIGSRTIIKRNEIDKLFQ